MHHIPVFHDFAVVVHAENIHQRGAAVLRIILAEHMQRHQIALGFHLFDLTAPLRVGLQNFGKGIDKRLRAIAYIGVVLDILAADMLVDRFLQLVLIKGQLVLKASS